MREAAKKRAWRGGDEILPKSPLTPATPQETAKLKCDFVIEVFVVKDNVNLEVDKNGKTKFKKSLVLDKRRFAS